jgi:hypothetical protein
VAAVLMMTIIIVVVDVGVVNVEDVVVVNLFSLSSPLAVSLLFASSSSLALVL